MAIPYEAGSVASSTVSWAFQISFAQVSSIFIIVTDYLAIMPIKG
ncbi:MAG: hypothetical protein ACXWNC_06665 [Anaerolineales bacterium]